MTVRQIHIIAREQAALVDAEAFPPLAPNAIRGRTLTTLISPGTELAFNYQGSAFPTAPGYAAVFLVEEVGSGVTAFRPGDHAFCIGPHRSVQQVSEADAVRAPENLPPEQAVITRLAGVTMTTLITTKARPGDKVLVTGAGPVGYLGAQLFQTSGYDVYVVDPDERRREIIQAAGAKAVFAEVPVEDPTLAGHVALVLECSGHEDAVLAGSRMVRMGGEVVLVGVPWKQCSEQTAHELLHAVFHRYAVLRSGWEWELPLHTTPQCPHSIYSGFATAMQWIAEGRLAIGEHIHMVNPQDPQPVYQSLLQRTAPGLFQVFDWSALDQ